MPTTAASGPISLAQNYLRLTIADSAEFKTWIGDATTQAQALARIHDDGLPPPDRGGEYDLAELKKARPYVIVSTDGFGWKKTAMSTAAEFANNGTLAVTFVQDVDEAIKKNHGEIGRRFQNSIGTIISEMLALAGTAGYLNITEVDISEGWTRTHPSLHEDEGDVVSIDVEFTWEEGEE